MAARWLLGCQLTAASPLSGEVFSASLPSQRSSGGQCDLAAFPLSSWALKGKEEHSLKVSPPLLLSPSSPLSSPCHDQTAVSMKTALYSQSLGSLDRALCASGGRRRRRSEEGGDPAGETERDRESETERQGKRDSKRDRGRDRARLTARETGKETEKVREKEFE